MECEWDPAKARANLTKHGIRFADAAAALEDDSALTIEEVDLGEHRWVTLGADARAGVLVFVYTWRDDRVRLISARRATRSERRQYEEYR